MDIFLKHGGSVENLGPRDGVASLFDTIACRLEPEGRGTRFPMVSTRMRLGRVTALQAARVVQELELIAPELRKLPAASILHAGAQAAAAANSMVRSANAADRLLAPDGRPLLEHLLAAAQSTVNTGEVLRLDCPGQTRRELLAVLGVSAAGIAWTIFAHALFPNWVLAPGDSAGEPSGIPLWTFGVLAPALALPTLAGVVAPAVKVWSALRPWGSATWYIVVAILWLVFALTR